MASLTAELTDDVGELKALTPRWHELAIANRLPMSLPEWTFSWQRHLAPADARLQFVVVRDRARVVGLAPMFVEPSKRGRVDYRIAGAPLPRLAPLAVPGREWEVAEAAARLLSQTRPRADAIALESHSVASPWPTALAEGWPSKLKPIAAQYALHPSPIVSMREASFDRWMAGKSANYRSEMRRRRRRFAEAGGTVRLSTAETIRDDVATFIRLHRDRWEGRGESSIVVRERQMQAYFGDVGEAYVRDGEFRLVLLELDGAPIAAQVHAAAGGEVVFLNGGWDETYARFSPSVLCLLAALEDAFARGDRRLDLGVGAQHYKLRMADGNDPVAWTLLMLPGARLPLTLTRTAPMLARRRLTGFAKRALTEEQVDRLRGLRRSLPG